MKGDALGPKLQFSFDTLDIQNVFVESSHSYEVNLHTYVRTYIQDTCVHVLIRYFSQKLDDKQQSSCVCMVTDRALTAVRTAYVPQDFNTDRFFSS